MDYWCWYRQYYFYLVVCRNSENVIWYLVRSEHTNFVNVVEYYLLGSFGVGRDNLEFFLLQWSLLVHRECELTTLLCPFDVCYNFFENVKLRQVSHFPILLIWRQSCLCQVYDLFPKSLEVCFRQLFHPKT